MITKFNNYLLLEKTNFNFFEDLNIKDLKLIFKDKYSIPTKFEYTKIDLDDIYDVKNIKINDFLQNKNDAILIIDTDIKALIFNNFDNNNNKYHIIDFKIKNQYNLNYNHDLYNLLFKDINKDAKIYKITFEKDISIKDKKDKITANTIIIGFYMSIYNSVFTKYYNDLYKKVVLLKKDMNNNINFDVRYYQEIHTDINTLYNLSMKPLFYIDENRSVSFNSILYNIIGNDNFKDDINLIENLHNKKIFNNEYYNSLTRITRVLAILIFKENRNYLNYTRYENIDREIEKDNTSFIKFKNDINDPKLKDKYNHLFNANNFDLF